MHTHIAADQAVQLTLSVIPVNMYKMYHFLVEQISIFNSYE